MIRNLKALGLALVAVLAMTAVAASAAQAQNGTFTAAEYPATITGVQTGEDKFVTNAGTVTCKHATYHGTLSESSPTLLVTPTYENCKAFGLFAATIDVNNCHYLFHVGATEIPPQVGDIDTYTGTVNVVCTGSEIVVTTSACTVKVGSQNDLNGITYDHNTGQGDVDVTVDSTNQIKYTVVSGCATTKAGTFTNGSYTGSATATGEKVPPASGALDVTIVD